VAITVYVDLSAKVEQWVRDSAVVMANEQQQRAFLVPHNVKQKARRLIKKLYGAKSDRYRLLTVLVYLVVRESLDTIDLIVIDKDYDGPQAEATIKNLLLALIRINKPDATSGMIIFENVKGSKADKLAKRIYDGKATAERVVSYEEIARLLQK
jgi:hypothetical protein